MAKFSSIKNTFQNGELSDKLVGRTDINEYGNGCKLLQNFIPLVSGGISKLPGSRYIQAKYSDGTNRTDVEGFARGLIPFLDLDRTPYLVELYRMSTEERGSGNVGDSIEIKIRGVDGIQVHSQSVFAGFIGDGVDYTVGWEYVQIGTTLVIVHSSGTIESIYLVKVGTSFEISTIENGGFTGVPGVPRNYMRIPYGPQSFDADRIFKASATAVGAAVGQLIDSGGGPVKFFRSYVIPGGPWRLENPYYVRVNEGSNSGIFKGGAAFAGDIAASSVTGNNITVTGHNFSKKDEVQLVVGQYSTGGGSGTLPSPLVAGTTYYVIVVDANTIQLAASEADADAGTAITLTDKGADFFNIIGTFTSKSPGENLLDLPTGSTSGLFSWQLGQWSFDQGYPRVVTSYDERIVLMSTLTAPDTVWNSRKGNIYHFMGIKLNQDQGSSDGSKNNYFGALDSTDAFSYLPASSEVGRISWASSQRSLYIGTDYSEFAISRVDGIYGPPNNFSIDPQTYHGASPVRAVRQGVTTLFITRDGKRVRDFRYSDNNGSNISRNLSILADQMHAHKFVSGDYNGLNFILTSWQESASAMWLLTSIGSVVSLTLDDSGNVAAWARHDFGGEVQSIVSLPSSNGDWDDVWFLVKRGVNYYLEYISEPFEHPLLVNSSNTPSDIPVYLHSAIVVTNSPASTAVTGLSHLEGEEVYCLADGVKQGPFTVTSGAITLDTAAEEIVVGLQYTSKMITMPLEAGAVIGSSQNLLKRVEQVLFKLYKSLGGKYGFGDRLYDFEYGTVTAGQTFTGNLDQVLHSTNAKDYRVVVEHSDPYPFTLLSAVMRGVTQE